MTAAHTQANHSSGSRPAAHPGREAHQASAHRRAATLTLAAGLLAVLLGLAPTAAEAQKPAISVSASPTTVVGDGESTVTLSFSWPGSITWSGNSFYFIWEDPDGAFDPEPLFIRHLTDQYPSVGEWQRPTSFTITITTQELEIDDPIKTARVEVLAFDSSPYVAATMGSATITVTPPVSPILVSNLDQATVPGSGFRHPTPNEFRNYSQAFHTGSESAGYLLSDVVLDVRAWTQPRRAPRVELRADASGDPATTALATLTPPGSLDVGENTFSAPGNIVLRPDTRYHIVVGVGSGSGNQNPGLSTTQSTALDGAGQTGWRLPSRVRENQPQSATPGAWSNFEENVRLSISILGGVAPSISVSATPTTVVGDGTNTVQISFNWAGTIDFGGDAFYFQVLDPDNALDTSGLSLSRVGAFENAAQWSPPVGGRGPVNDIPPLTARVLEHGSANKTVTINVASFSTSAYVAHPTMGSVEVTVTPRLPLTQLINFGQQTITSGDRPGPSASRSSSQSFRTGPSSNGYTLSHIVLDITSWFPPRNPLIVELRADSSTTPGDPDTATLATLTNPADLDANLDMHIASGRKVFTAPENTSLEPDTTYHIVLRLRETFWNSPRFRVTTSTTPDSESGAGWSLPATARSGNREAGGGWSEHASNTRYALSIHGEVVDAPSVITVRAESNVVVGNGSNQAVFVIAWTGMLTGGPIQYTLNDGLDGVQSHPDISGASGRATLPASGMGFVTIRLTTNSMTFGDNPRSVGIRLAASSRYEIPQGTGSAGVLVVAPGPPVLLDNFSRRDFVLAANRPNPSAARSTSQPFRTGSESHGYTLGGVELQFASWSTPRNALAVELRADERGNPAGATLATLTRTETTVNFIKATFVAPANTRLDPDTTYHIVLRLTGTDNDPSFSAFQSATLDSESLAGWSLPAGVRQGNAAATGGWGPHANSGYYGMTIRGEVTPEPPTVTVRAVDDTLTEGTDTQMEWTVSLNMPAPDRLRVSLGYHWPNGRTREAESVTFNAGESSKTHRESITDDDVVDPDVARLFVVETDDGSYLVGNPSEATITVAEDDTELTIEPETMFAQEGVAYRFVIRRTGHLGTEFRARMRQEWSSNVPAEMPTALFRADQDRVVYETGNDDDNDRTGDDLSVTVTLTPQAEYSVGDPSVATIVRFDNDVNAVAITVEACDGADEVMEGAPARFRFTRHGDTAQELAVGFMVSQVGGGGNNVLGSRPAGSTTSYSEEGTFGIGASTFCHDVPTLDDMLDEPDSIVRVTLDASGTGWRRGGLDLDSHLAEVTVLDDDLPVVTLEAVRDAFEESEGGAMFRVTRTRSLVRPGGSGLVVRVLFTGSSAFQATNGADHLYNFVIGRGELTSVDRVERITDDNTPSEPYQVSIRLEEPAPTPGRGFQYTIGSPSSATVTIYDRDGRQVVSAAPAAGNNQATEGDTLMWQLSRMGGSTSAALSVPYTIRFSDESPLTGDTYTLTGTATFAGGATTTPVSLATMEDDIGEPGGFATLELGRSPTFAWVVEGDVDAQTEAARITLLDDDLGPPAGLATQPGMMSIVLQWGAPPYTGGATVTGYRIEQSDDGSTGWTDLVADTGNTDTTYTHGGLAEDQVVHYRVSAISASSTSVASSVVSGMAGGAGPTAPTNLMAANAILSIRLDWTAPTGVTGITGYRIEQSADGSTGWTVLVADTERTATRYAHVGLAAGRTVHYRVSAIGASMFAGAASNTASATAQALSGQATGAVMAEETEVVGDGVNEVVFIINTSDAGNLDVGFSITGTAAITGETAEDVPDAFSTFVNGEQHRIRTVALAPGSAPIDVTFTFVPQAATGLSESGHAIVTDLGSATVRVTAPPARRENPVLFRSTARAADISSQEIAADRWYSQPFTLAGNSDGYDGYDIDSVVLLLETTNGQPVSSTSAEVTLRTDDGSGNPGDSDTILATMQHPSMIRHGRLATFTAPAAGIRLDAGIKYHVVVHVPAGGADSGIRWLTSRSGARSGFDFARTHRGTSWAEEAGAAMMLQLRGSEVVDLSLPEITVRAEADTVLGDGRNFVRFFLVRSENFPERAVQYTLPATGGVNDALETDTEATYTYSGSGTSEPIRLRTEAPAPGGDPIDVTFNLLPGTGYRVGGTGSKTVTVTPLPAPALVGNQEAVNEALAVVRRGRDYAQKFTTGSNTGGYTLDAVVVSTGTDPLRSGYDPSVPVIMTIRGEDPSGDPASAVVGTLTEPATIIDGRNAFTAQETIELDAETSYYVVISQDVPASTGGIPLDGPQPAQNAFDSDSLADWSIEDRLLWNQSSDRSWGAAGGGGSSRALTIRLLGEPVVGEPVVSVLHNGNVMSGEDAVFTLSRTEDPAAALTVNIRISGSGVQGTVPRDETATFPAGDPTVEVSVPTVTIAPGGSLRGAELRVLRGAGYDVVGGAILDRASLHVLAPRNNPATGEAVLTGTPEVGQVLTAAPGMFADADGLTPPTTYEEYLWTRVMAGTTSEEEFLSTTVPTYTLVDADIGHNIHVVLVFRDDLGFRETRRSNSVGPVVAAGTAPAPDTAPAFGASETIAEQQWTIGTAVTTLQLPTATGGNGALRYALTPGLPSGVTLSGGPTCASGCSLSGTPMGISAVRDGVTYTWRVDDADANTVDGDAGLLSFDITVTATAPDAPTGLSATARPLSIELSWTAPANEGGRAITGYFIERGDAVGACSGSTTFMALVANTGNTAITHTDMGLTAGETWCYRVSAINAVDTGAASDTASATAAADAAPEFVGGDPPVRLSIEGQQWTIRTPVTLQLPLAMEGDGASRYALTPALPNGVTLNGAPACASGCTISGTPAGAAALRDGVTYTWRVEDTDTNTAESDADELTFDITVAPAVPVAPTGLVATANIETLPSSGANEEPMLDLSIVLAWTAPTDNGGSSITGYRIERADDACSSTTTFPTTPLEANTRNRDLTYTDKDGLTLEGTWCYRVSAINSVGPGDASDPVSASFVSEDQLLMATEAALSLLAPNIASGTIQVLTARFDSFSAPGGAGAARNTAMLGGRPLGSFANESASGLDVAREVASFFGVSLPHVRAGYGRGARGYGGAAMRDGASGYGAAAGAGYGGSVSGGGYGAGDAAGTGGAAVGNAGGASAELAFAPAVQGELEAQARQRNTEGRGANIAGVWRRQDLRSWLGVGDLQSPDLKSMLPQSSFSVTLGAANGAADDPGGAGGIFAGRWTVWGQGAAGGFEGTEKDTAISVEGDSISAYLGVDVQRGNLALGVALGQSSGDMDYAGSAEGGASGSLETELTSLHPYLNWSPNPELSMYLMLGYGVGEADLTEDKLDQTWNTDLDMLMLALGGRRALGGGASGRRYEVKVDAFTVGLETDGAKAASGGVSWRAADSQASRLRAALAASAPLPVGPANSLVAEGELAARLDGGDAQTGVGAELGAGLRWQQGGFSLAARGRLLLVHSENDYEDYKEWGASLTASYDAGQAGRGFRATLSPVWGDAGSDAGALYEGAGALRDVGGGAGVRRSGLLPDRLAFEFGYGVGLLGGRALLLPFGSFSFAGGGDASSDTQLRLGTRVDLSRALGVVGGGGEFSVQRLGFELFGETQSGADREQRFGLDLKLGF